jgi:hypothetical protein
VQRLRASPGGPVQDTRRLSSDVAFVRVPGTALPWYRRDQALGLWVPAEMRDRLQSELVGPRGRSGSVELVEGLAAYSGFRKAGVTMQEEFRVPEPDPR